jgi:NAD(P)H-dependent FMN reductase
MHVALILGSIRTERLSERPALYLKKQLEDAGHTVNFLDLRELDIPLFADAPEVPAGATRFIEGITSAEAIIIVTPEYNHSYSSALKSAIDYLRKREFLHRPVAVVGVSDGLVGGARAIAALRASLPTLGAVFVPTAVALPETQVIFPDATTCTSEKTRSQFTAMLRELEAYAPALSQVRQTLTA